MSTLAATYLKDRVLTPTLPVTTAVRGLKAWALISGISVPASLYAPSLNISSVGDNGVGNYTYTYTAAMASNIYSVAYAPSSGATMFASGAAGSIVAAVSNFAGTPIDVYHSMMTAGDLA